MISLPDSVAAATRTSPAKRSRTTCCSPFTPWRSPIAATFDSSRFDSTSSSNMCASSGSSNGTSITWTAVTTASRSAASRHAIVIASMSASPATGTSTCRYATPPETRRRRNAGAIVLSSRFILRRYAGHPQPRLKTRASVLRKGSRCVCARIDEPVARTGLGEDVARPCRVVLDLAPQLRHVHVQVVRLVAVERPPHLPQDHAVRQQLSLVLREVAKELELVRRQ